MNTNPAYDDEGEVVGAYAYAVLPDGSLHVEYMNKRQLDHIKAKSKSRSGPWTTDPEEMYRKTPVKRLFKYLPVPDEVEYAVQVDNLAENGRSRDDIPLLDKTPEDLNIPQTEKIKEKIKRAKKLDAPEAASETKTENPTTTTDPDNTKPPKGITEVQRMELLKVPPDLLADAFMECNLEPIDLVELDEATSQALIEWVRLAIRRARCMGSLRPPWPALKLRLRRRA